MVVLAAFLLDSISGDTGFVSADIPVIMWRFMEVPLVDGT